MNLILGTKGKLGSDIIEVVNLNYISAILEYGNGENSFSYDISTNDPNPETASTSIFIGSYVGGCIQILDWRSN